MKQYNKNIQQHINKSENKKQIYTYEQQNFRDGVLAII